MIFDLLKSGKYDKFIKALNELGPTKINIKDDNNNYLITHAIIRNNIDIVKVLLKKGANIDILDQEGKTILYLPIKYGYDEICSLLLDHDKKIDNILVNLKDNNNNVPLHYAILFKNTFALTLLLEAGANPNITDNDGNNALHLSIYSKNYKICDIILSTQVNVNAQTLIGESALHISCNLKLAIITELLLKHDIDPNLQDSNNEITALVYTIYLHDVSIFKILLQNNADPNIQDSMGNSAIHHIVIEDSDELLYELLKNNKQTLNFNTHNIDGKLPVHLLLEKVIKENDDTKYVVGQSNLNYQDMNGNTALHHICKKHLWKFLGDILIKKKLDVFIKNNSKILPVDYVSKHDIDEFLELVAFSYSNLLHNKIGQWAQDWENACTKPLYYDSLDNKEKQIMAKYKLNKKEELCGQIIMKKLHDLYKCKGTSSTCTKNCSYPIKYGSKCIKIHKYEHTETCNFVGVSIDILIGLIFLLNKHSNACSTLTTNFIKNDQLCSYLSVLGFEINKKCEFMNFEIIWIYKKLFFSDNFTENFKRCVNNNKIRFVIIPLGIEIKEGGHANYIIFDKESFSVERFEPYGAHSPSNYDYNENLLDSLLSFKFNEIYNNITYVSPIKYLPKIGFQYIDVYEKKNNIGDPGGFCSLWAIWYVDMRLTHPDYDRKNLANKLLQEVRRTGISFKNLIRNYSVNVTSIRDEIFAKSNITINNWINDEYTLEEYDNIINNIIKLLRPHADQ